MVGIHIRAQFLIQPEEVKNGCFQNAMDMICKHFNSKYNQTFISGSVYQIDLPLPSFKSTMISFIWQIHLCFTIHSLAISFSLIFARMHFGYREHFHCMVKLLFCGEQFHAECYLFLSCALRLISSLLPLLLLCVCVFLLNVRFCGIKFA